MSYRKLSIWLFVRNRILEWFTLHEVPSAVIVSRSRETETERFKTMQLFLCVFFRSECISNLSLLRNSLHGGAPRRGATGHHLFHILQRHNIFRAYTTSKIEFSFLNHHRVYPLTVYKTAWQWGTILFCFSLFLSSSIALQRVPPLVYI